MKYLPILGLTVAIVCGADLAVAKTPAEIEAIAKAVTVEIRLLQDESIGSGIIIERKGDLYTLITNHHVICGIKKKNENCTTPLLGETYSLKLGDGQEYKVAAKSVKILGGNLDLAIIQFRSNRGYPVAQIADPGSLKVGAKVFTSGYPAMPPGFSFNAGEAIAVVDKRLTGDRGGYTVIYDAQTQPGMSGGGVFSEAGRLVAVHGQGERYRDNTQSEVLSPSGTKYYKQEVGSKIGYNRGIPVRWLVQGLAELGIKLGNRQPVNLGQTVSSADEHFITGFNRWVEPGADIVAGKRLAIGEFSQAIRIDPRYATAYFMRGSTYQQLQEERRAFADFNQVIALNPQFVAAYNNRGMLKKDKFNDPQGALADFNQAIALDSQYATAYSNRGLLKRNKLNDPQGALADYNRAITLDPQFATTYNSRGVLKKNELNDPQGALADYNRAIALNPQFATAYYNRGLLKEEKLNDPQGALADYNRAIALNPQLATAYYNRGLLKKEKLNDPRGALADYNQAIALDPQDANAYYNRGILKQSKLNDFKGALADYNQAIVLDRQFATAYGARGYLKYTQLGDRSGGIADMRQATKLSRAQGNSSVLQTTLQILLSWGVGE
jgi:tetratricopeptide (TPR) repeat protein